MVLGWVEVGDVNYSDIVTGYYSWRIFQEYKGVIIYW